MEFLKSLVPVISREPAGAVPRDTGSRLLHMKRLGLLVMGHTIDEDQVAEVIPVDPRISSSKPGCNNRSHLKGTTENRVSMLDFLNIRWVHFLADIFRQSHTHFCNFYNISLC